MLQIWPGFRVRRVRWLSGEGVLILRKGRRDCKLCMGLDLGGDFVTGSKQAKPEHTA